MVAIENDYEYRLLVERILRGRHITIMTHCNRMFVEASTSAEQKQSLLNRAFHLCYDDDHVIHPEFQLAALHSGLIDTLVRSCQDTTHESPDVRACAFNALGTFAFKNDVVCTYLLSSTTLVDVVLDVIDTDTSPFVRQRALYSLNNIVCQLVEMDARLYRFVPRLVEFIHDESVHLDIRRTSVTFLCSFANNEQAHRMLVEVGAIDAFGRGFSEQLLQCILDALIATLAGHDYPTGSNGFYTDWKLVLGIGRMCSYPPARKFLLENHVVSLLHLSIRTAQEQSQPRLAKEALNALWLVTHPTQF